MYVIMTCPPDWRDSETRNRCENPDTSYRDPLLEAPVTSTSTNTTYRNWHCASCHRDLDANSAVIWEAKFQCHIHTGLPFILVSEDTFTKYLLYDTYNSQWNFNIDKHDLDTDPGIQLFLRYVPGKQQQYKYKCNLVFIPQPNVLKTVRFCRTDIITQCPPHWIATEEQKQCNAYTAHVCSGRKTYRNYHCFLCNNFPTLEHCEPPTPYPTQVVLEYAPSFSVLLDWKRLKKGTCASSEKYDPLARVCRKVFT
jgi:hypothetical protein